MNRLENITEILPILAWKEQRNLGDPFPLPFKTASKADLNDAMSNQRFGGFWERVNNLAPRILSSYLSWVNLSCDVWTKHFCPDHLQLHRVYRTSCLINVYLKTSKVCFCVWWNLVWSYFHCNLVGDYSKATNLCPTLTSWCLLSIKNNLIVLHNIPA